MKKTLKADSLLPLKVTVIEAIIEAVKSQDVAALKRLIDQGGDVNEVNESDRLRLTPAMHASHNGNTEGLALLIQAGVNVNAKGVYGWTPAMHAASKGHFECLAFLIAEGYDISVQNRRQETALSLAKTGEKIDGVDMIEAALEAQILKASLESVTNPAKNNDESNPLRV